MEPLLVSIIRALIGGGILALIYYGLTMLINLIAEKLKFDPRIVNVMVAIIFILLFAVFLLKEFNINF